MRRILQALLIILPVLAAGFAAAQPGGAADNARDEYLRGYAAAVLAEEFGLPAECVEVRQGVAQLACLPEGEARSRRLVARLEAIPGMRGVAGPEATAKAEVTGKAETELERIIFLPEGMLFKPLMADPRWPHFSASYQHFVDAEEVRHGGSATFGETFPIIRLAWARERAADVGLQAAVFSLFDLAGESTDLINADYWVAIPANVRLGDFSALVRFYHQSSHLGDEFLLENPGVERINLSYEALEAILSQDLPLGLRVYGGGEFILHREPKDLDRPGIQAGLEFRSPWTTARGTLRPVAGLDLQSTQEGDWDPAVSLRAGMQLEDPLFVSRRLQILFEYYVGSSPNGQFYPNDIQLFGLGLHLQYD